MTITIVIPVYNKGGQIKRALESVRSQTHASWKIIAVDDGSDDESVVAIEEVSDSRICCVRQENRGVSAARNRGVALSETEWISFLDADDEYLPEYLSRLVEFIQNAECEDLVMVASNYRSGSSDKPSFPSEIPTGIANYFALCTGNRTPVNSSTAMVRRDAFLKCGGFPEGIRIFEDWTCWMKLAALGSFAFVNETLSIYHDDSNERASTRRRHPEEIMTCVRAVLESGSRILSDPGISQGKRQAVAGYLNRYLLRSASPLMLKNGAIVDAWRLLFSYHRFAHKWSDWAQVPVLARATIGAVRRKLGNV